MNIPAGSYGSSITIDEITGSRGWSITLLGAGLPHQGAAWGAENRIPTEFYPGNFTEGTQQVIGPKESPSHWTGVWKRTLLLRSPAFITPGGQSVETATPSTLADFFEQILLGGARLRITWTQTKIEYVPGASPGSTFTQTGMLSYQKVREGRASKWDFTPMTGDDIKWDVSWKWASRGGSQQKVVSTRDSDASSSTAAVSSAITDALTLTGTLSPQAAANPLVPFSAVPLTLGTYETVAPGFIGLSLGLNAGLFSLQTSFSLTATVSLSIGGVGGGIDGSGGASYTQVNNSILNLSIETVSTVNTFSDQVGQIPFEVLSTSVQATDVAYAGGIASAQVYQAWAVREAAQNAATKARILASTNPGGGAKGVQQTSATGTGQLLGVYRTRDGDTPQRVARNWYGNADKAGDLLRANHLPLGQPSFVSGTVLLIPVLRSSSASGG